MNLKIWRCNSGLEPLPLLREGAAGHYCGALHCGGLARRAGPSWGPCAGKRSLARGVRLHPSTQRSCTMHRLPGWRGAGVHGLVVGGLQQSGENQERVGRLSGQNVAEDLGEHAGNPLVLRVAGNGASIPCGNCTALPRGQRGTRQGHHLRTGCSSLLQS